ncbi:MAG: sulfite exporter TauE/SafE family protein [Planctomycetota bacterium]
MPDFTFVIWVLVVFYAITVGIAKTGVPGIGLLGVVALITFSEDAKTAVGLMLPLLVAGDLFALAYYRRHAVWRHVLRLLPWAVAGILIGHQAIGLIDDHLLRRIIGGLTIALLAADLWRSSGKEKAEVPTQWWFAAVIGVLAGFATMIANAAGPLIIVYFLAMRLEKEQFLGTGAWYFLILNCFKVPFFLHRKMITTGTLAADLVLLPAIAAGALAGVFLLKRIPQTRFVMIVRILTLLAAVKLLAF